MSIGSLTVSAPGRICLFGEHQDYLGLPVITAAINLRIKIEGRQRADRTFSLKLPDIGESERIDLSRTIMYKKERDYFRSGLNVLIREGLEFKYGYDCTVHGTIPINSGTSSSSALIVAWIKFLLQISSDSRRDDPFEIARLAHRAEVIEFNEPGGMMDHFAASFGSILYIDFSDSQKLKLLDHKTGNFVLGDSLEPKDTKKILSRVKDGTLSALLLISKKNRTVNMKNISLEQLQNYKGMLSREEFYLIRANIINREITKEAISIFKEKKIDSKRLGELLNAHQAQLREGLRISTPKIDRMIEFALKAGAAGAKINGSGGGGCMFAYAPNNTEEVAEAIRRAGGKPYIVSVDEGVRLD